MGKTLTVAIVAAQIGVANVADVMPPGGQSKANEYTSCTNCGPTRLITHPLYVKCPDGSAPISYGWTPASTPRPPFLHYTCQSGDTGMIPVGQKYP